MRAEAEVVVARHGSEAEQLRAEAARHGGKAEAARAAAERAWEDFRAAAARASQAEQETAGLRAWAEQAEARTQLMKIEAGEEAASAAAQVAELQKALTLVQAERDSVLTSTAWRATWAARAIGQHLPYWLRRVVRGSAKLGWWTVTMKLPRKLRERQEALRAYHSIADVPTALATSPPSPVLAIAAGSAPAPTESSGFRRAEPRLCFRRA